MKNTVKLLIFALCAALLISVFGCKKSDKSNEEKKDVVSNEEKDVNETEKENEEPKKTEEEMEAEREAEIKRSIDIVKKYKVYEQETKNGERNPKVLAKVLGREINEDQLNLLLESFKIDESNPDYAKIKKDMLFNIVRSNILFEKADELGYAPTEEEIDTEIKNHKESKDEFINRQDNEVSKAMGLTRDEYIDSLRKDYRESLIVRNLQREFIEKYEGSNEFASLAFTEFLNDLYRNEDIEYLVDKEEIPETPEKKEVPSPEEVKKLVEEFQKNNSQKDEVDESNEDKE